MLTDPSGLAAIADDPSGGACTPKTCPADDASAVTAGSESASAARTRYGRDAMVLGLVPAYPVARERKAEPKAIEIAHAAIKELVFTKARRPYHTGYKIYAERCLAETTQPVSMKTYRLEIRRLANHGATARRFGRKIANAQRGVRSISLFPVDGDRAFERVHIDHTLLDIVLIDSVTGEEIGRPWLTIAIDAYTRRILGHVLTFDAPGAGKVMLIMRDIVARYGRLPTMFVVDNGSEFKSTYFQATVAAYDRSIEYRPPGDPRFGALIESCFGKIDRDFIHALEGNTVGRKDLRAQDPKHDASITAIWDLPHLEELLATYFYEVYDQMRSKTAGLSPRQRFEKSLAEAGVADTEAISDDKHFRVMTARSSHAAWRSAARGSKPRDCATAAMRLSETACAARRYVSAGSHITARSPTRLSRTSGTSATPPTSHCWPIGARANCASRQLS